MFTCVCVRSSVTEGLEGRAFYRIKLIDWHRIISYRVASEMPLYPTGFESQDFCIIEFGISAFVA